MTNAKKKIRARKGFSLVELVIVILIIAVLAVAVFAGGSVVVKKAQVARTTSDLHNFSVAIESFMNENPSLLNVATTDDFDADTDDLVKAFNANLPEDYQIKALSTSGLATGGTLASGTIKDSGGNITTAKTTTSVIFESAKTDAWGNSYYVIFDYAERHGASNSDFYITVVSAGPDAKTALCGQIGGSVVDGKEDDIFLLAQNTNGDVSAVIYNTATDTLHYAKAAAATDDGTWTVEELERKSGTSGYYSVGDSTYTNSIKCPINF